MTVRQLIDFLESLKMDDVRVVSSEDEIDEPCEFISLDYIGIALKKHGAPAVPENNEHGPCLLCGKSLDAHDEVDQRCPNPDGTL